MHDTDADEPVAPPQRFRLPSFLVDRILAVTGVCLAFGSAVFPWYVFLNPDKFGFGSDSMDNTRDLSLLQARNVFSVSPLALVSKDKSDQKPPADLDTINTATISNVGREVKDAKPAKMEQPFPGADAFRLLHVANGRALIEDASGMFMVKVGSILPDNSKVAVLEKRDGKWVIVTTSGAIYKNQ
ncbi:flagellar protein [Rhizobium sp.]|uniref:flagellar protein n=1 Tax=Rhizobium sp. TaxID=391 RepID=UPI000E9B21D7|nr:flagellar protein [Rhizobium sp.]